MPKLIMIVIVVFGRKRREIFDHHLSFIGLIEFTRKHYFNVILRSLQLMLGNVLIRLKYLILMLINSIVKWMFCNHFQSGAWVSQCTLTCKKRNPQFTYPLISIGFRLTSVLLGEGVGKGWYIDCLKNCDCVDFFRHWNGVWSCRVWDRLHLAWRSYTLLGSKPDAIIAVQR